MQVMPTPTRNQGFSLLEALVALVVITGIGTAVYGWINTNLIAIERSRNAIDRSEAVAAALTVMEDINPMASPQGEAEYAGYRIRWNSTPIEEPRQGRSRTGGNSLYRVGLYRVELRVGRPDAASVDFVVRQTGHRQIQGTRNESEPAL